MTTIHRLRPATQIAAALLWLVASVAGAQTWRRSAASLGTTARVLLIGTHPEDEDNALTAWLSLGRNVETAYLSLTRGEGGVNLVGSERQAPLAVVRTAELLAERQRDGAHQYFTRAYDFGHAKSDTVVESQWPRDSLLRDVVSVIRAFRPHVVISLFSEGGESDPMHQAAARLAREGVAAAADSAGHPANWSSRLPAWRVSRLLTLADAESAGAGSVRINVGEFDRDAGKTFAEIGADIRALQRTQPPRPTVPMGEVWRTLRSEDDGAERASPGLFADVDTSWARFRAAGNAEIDARLDSLSMEVARVRGMARDATPTDLAAALAQVVKRAIEARLAIRCGDVAGVSQCPGILGDVTVSITTLRERATRALLGASGIVIDGTVERPHVALEDSAAVTVQIYNGSGIPIAVRHLGATARGGSARLVSNGDVVVPPDSVGRWTTSLKVNQSGLHWWQSRGLVYGRAIHIFGAPRNGGVIPELISGEDRLRGSSIEATIAIAGVDIPIIETPIAYRAPGALRGDTRRPLTGVTPISVLLERTAEYERANIPLDRLFRVFLSSVQTQAETVTVSLSVPPGIRVDSATRVTVVQPASSQSVFFRLRGTVKPGSDSISASVHSGPPVTGAQAGKLPRPYTYGVITRDYPHLPSLQFFRAPGLRLESVDLRVPSQLRVAYIKGSEDLQTWFGQLQLNVQTLEPSLLRVVDLSVFSSILIGGDAFANDALASAIPALVNYARRGGTIVILPGTDVATSGLLPFPIAFDTAGRTIDTEADLRAGDARTQIASWPNLINGADFASWLGERARHLPASYDPRYREVFLMTPEKATRATPGVLVGPLGRGRVIYSALSLDRQIAAVNAGGARLLVNLLSAGFAPPSQPR